MENPSRKRIINKTKPTNLLTTPSLLPPPKKKHTTKKEKKQNKNITLLKQKNPPKNTWFFHAMILFYGTIDALNDWMVIEIDCMMKLLKYHGFFLYNVFYPPKRSNFNKVTKSEHIHCDSVISRTCVLNLD